MNETADLCGHGQRYALALVLFPMLLRCQRRSAESISIGNGPAPSKVLRQRIADLSLQVLHLLLELWDFLGIFALANGDVSVMELLQLPEVYVSSMNAELEVLHK